MRITLFSALIGGALAGAALAQVTEVQVEMRAGDTLPGSAGTVDTIEGVAVAVDGAWVAQLTSAGTGVVVSATAELARVGDALAPGSSTLAGFRNFVLRDDGSLVSMLDLAGGGVDRGAYEDLSPLLVQGDACSAYPGQSYADMGPAVVANQVGQLLLFPRLDASPTHTRLILVTTVGGVVTSQVDPAPMGTTLTGGPSPVVVSGMPSVVSGTEFDLNDAGLVIYPFLTSGTNVGIAVGGTAVARVGLSPPAAVGAGVWSSLGDRPAALNDHGDFAFRGATQNPPFAEQQVLVKNVGGAWQLVARIGQVLPATGLPLQSFGSRIFLAENGELVWSGVCGGKAGVYLDDDQLLVQEQHTVDGYAIETLDIDVDQGMDASDDGYTVAIAAGNAVDGDALLLVRRRFPSFCDGRDLGACPCAAGSPDSGCDTPQATGGVALEVLSQTTNPNGATLIGTGFPSMAAPTAIVLRSAGLDPASPVVFGDGLRCVDAFGLTRLAAVTAHDGTSTHVFGHGGMAGPGSYAYQLWFRSTPGSYCTPEAFNLSNGRMLQW